jgi:hypothetical protein
MFSSEGWRLIAFLYPNLTVFFQLYIFVSFGSSKPWIWIRIRIETNADPKHHRFKKCLESGKDTYAWCTSIPRPAETNVWNVKSEKCVDFSSGIFPTLTSAVYPYPGHVSCPTISVIFGLFSILVLHFPFSLVAYFSTLIFLIAPFSPWPHLRSFL